MTSGEPVQRVRIYLNERDLREGQALYLTVLERLRREGATGATALRGMAGFGPGQRARATITSVGETQPVVIEWVDRVDRIARVMPMLDDLLDEALVTIEELRAYRARLRSSGPFGSQSVGEAMDRAALAFIETTTVREALRQLLIQYQPILPVVDSQRRVVAVLTDGDLNRRVGLPLPLEVIQVLRPEEREDLLRVVSERPLAELITDEPRTGYVQASIPQVVATMIEWGLEALPVVDRDGCFAGLVGVEQALQAARETRSASDGAIRDAELPPHVRLLMQTSVPTIAAATPAPATLRQILAAAEHFLVVVEAGKPIGILTLAIVLAQIEAPLRYEFLQALRPASAPPAFVGADPQWSAATLAATAPTIAELATQDDAIAIMLTDQIERLVVINEEGLLVGLLGRRALLRGLAQLSA
jgi:PII-like signaling protein